MGLQVKLLVMCVFLVLSTLSFCQAKNATVKVVGLIHCTDCFKNYSSSNSSHGFDVFITCNARKNETKAQGNGGVDMHGKFNVTLSPEIEDEEDATEIDGCYAKLQSRSGAPCHIQQPRTASVKILSNAEKQAVIFHRPTVIKFSPLTCQSAFFWPFPNLTFFASPPPPPEYIAPPSPENLAPASSPVQPPLPPAENSTPPPQPSYDPPTPSLPPPEIEAPSPPPAGSPPPASPPTYRSPADPTIRSPSPPPQAPPLPSSPVYNNPSPSPSSPPLPPPQAPPKRTSPKTPNYPTPPTTVIPPPVLASSPLPPQQPLLPPPSAAIPSRRRPSPIPKAPPIPQLPRTPSIPRKYFNPPNSRSKPPHFL